MTTSKKYPFNSRHDLAELCFRSCFDSKSLQLSEPCAATCYKNYLHTLRDVTASLRELGYLNHSVFAYKAFPQHQPYFDLIYSQKYKTSMADLDFAYDFVH